MINLLEIIYLHVETVGKLSFCNGMIVLSFYIPEGGHERVRKKKKKYEG